MALRSAQELAILIGREQRHIRDIGVRQVDAEPFAGLRLDVSPGGEAALRTFDEATRGDGQPPGVKRVLRGGTPGGTGWTE